MFKRTSSSIVILTLWVGMIYISQLTGCVDQPKYSIVPHIDSVIVSKTQVNTTFANVGDSIRIIVAFTDGDGDIGNAGNPTPISRDSCRDHHNDTAVITDPAYNVYWFLYRGGDSCIDHRSTANVTGYDGGASGQIWFYPFLECPPTGNTDTVVFSVFIKDRAGHVSNRIHTPPIVITCH